ncbi:MAG TPA: transglycosylase domain-containing protein [Actinomycetaceae bacterium]|nr:transglycosylase domain-containing protein [Actinomycetaceae bacterium]
MATNKRPNRVSTRDGATKPGYPRDPGGNHAKKGEGRGRRSWWKWLLGLLLAGTALVSGILVAAYVTIDIPEPDDFAQAQTTTVYFADGETVMGEFSEYDRSLVETADLPEHVLHAIVASEDRNFYENPGIDLRGTTRALWNNLRGGPTQGGSTITQQYVERYYLGTTTSIPGKFKEAILALKISAESDKETILENYLNTIYFGRGAYGIEVAAQNYFGKPAAELTLSEAALLAGIVPSPSRWDPAVDQARAEQRWNRVLDLMLEDGWITEQERRSQVFPTTIDYVPTDTFGGTDGYVLNLVREELQNKAGITAAELDTAGLSITTTIDPMMQQAAVDAVGTLPEGHAPNMRVGLVSMVPGSGAVRALYGGPDFLEVTRNAVTQDRAQMGSTAKVFGLISALENGAQLGDRFASYDDMVIPGYDFPVSNYDSHDRGRINLVDATAESVNTVFVQMNVKYGPENTRDAMIRAGISEDTPSLDPVPSNVLGSAAATPWDMVRAYGTIASGGERYDPYVVSEVLDRNGNARYRAQEFGERVFDEQVMAETTYAMQSVVQRGTATRAALPDRPAAGKTGSSNNYRSAWFGGFVPQLVTVVSMYQPGPNGEEEVITPFGGFAQISGGSFPAMIWHEFMSRATEGMEVMSFPNPGPINLAPETPTSQPTVEPTTQEPETEEPAIEEPETEEPAPELPTEEPDRGPDPDRGPEPTTEPTEEPDYTSSRNRPPGAGDDDDLDEWIPPGQRRP